MKIRTNESRFSDLAKALEQVDDNGRHGECGSWGMSLGGYDTGYEISYDGETIGRVNYEDKEYELYRDDCVSKDEVPEFLSAIDADGFKDVGENDDAVELDETEPDEVGEATGFKVATVHPGGSSAKDDPCGVYVGDELIRKFPSWNAAERWLEKWSDELADEAEIDYLEEGVEAADEGHVLVREDAGDNTKSRTESLKLTADYFLGQLRGLVDKVSKEDSEGAKLFFKNANNTLKDLVRQFEDLKANF